MATTQSMLIQPFHHSGYPVYRQFTKVGHLFIFPHTFAGVERFYIADDKGRVINRVAYASFRDAYKKADGRKRIANGVNPMHTQGYDYLR